MTPKIQYDLQELIAKLTVLDEINSCSVSTIIANAKNHAHRLIKRANVADGMDRVELDQTKGPKICFNGALIRREEYKRAHDGMMFACELWNTSGTQWVAIWESDIHVTAKVFGQGDEVGVMEFWQWGSVAWTMANKLKWDLSIEID